MYQIEDKPSAIKEVQKFLHIISDSTDYGIPRISIDGVYGDETYQAVRLYQEYHGLNPTGKTDLTTFDMLYREYYNIMLDKNTKEYIITDEGFPIVIGTQNSDVSLVHSIINELSKAYPYVKKVDRSNYFSQRSAESVKQLQKIFMLAETGEVDKFLYERLKQEIDSVKRVNEKYN